MKIFTVPEAQQSILKRRPWDELDVPQSLMDGIQSIFGERLHPEEVVRRILRDVRQRGDLAILDWTRQIDRIDMPENTPVSGSTPRKSRSSTPV